MDFDPQYHAWRKAKSLMMSGFSLACAILVITPLLLAWSQSPIRLQPHWRVGEAVLLLLEREKILAEGAGAAALAALVNRRIPTIREKTGKKIIAIVSGGNIDVTLLARIIERGLVKDGRLVRLRVHLPDYPGALHRLTGILAGSGRADREPRLGNPPAFLRIV
jgi:hypothetical protein